MKPSHYLPLLAVLGFGIAIWHQEREIAAVVAAARVRVAATAGPEVGSAPSCPGKTDSSVRPDGVAIEQGRIKEIGVWLSGLNSLRRALAEHPEWNVPETALLREDDWLGLAHTFRFVDTPEKLRVALAELRTVGKSRYAGAVSRALKAYAEANGGLLPPSLADLKTYLEPTFEIAWLDRYELVRTGSMKDVPAGKSVVMEKSPVDPEFDQRIGVPARGGAPTYNRWSGPSFASAVSTATASYLSGQAAGRTPNEDAVAAHLTSPVAVAIANSVTEFRRAHGGLDPARPSELLPYTTDPATRAEIERLDALRTSPPH